MPQVLHLSLLHNEFLNLSRVYRNPGLKPSFTNNLRAEYNNYIEKHQMSIMTSVNYSNTRNSIGYKVTYDEKTGGRISRPENINGNWNAAYSVTYRSRLDKEEHWSYQTATGYTYVNSVDLIGTSATADRAVRSKVGSHYITESALLRYAPPWFAEVSREVMGR